MNRKIKKTVIFHLDDDEKTLASLKKEIAAINHSISQGSTQTKSQKQYHWRGFTAAKKFFSAMKRTMPSLVILDIELSQDQDDLSGLDVCKLLRTTHPHLPIYVYTNFMNGKNTHLAMKAGADDIIPKDLRPYLLAAQIMERYHDIETAKEVVTDHKLSHESSLHVIGKHMKMILGRVKAITSSALRGGAIISGNKGVGKTFVLNLFDHAIPKHTPKARFPELPFDQAIEKAQGGWLLIEQVENLTLEQQQQLVSYLEKGQLRIIGTTSRDVAKLRESPECEYDFIRDLMVRHFSLQDLKDRKQDIPEFISYFLSQVPGRSILVSTQVQNLLISYDYPRANVAELESVIKEATSVLSGSSLSAGALPSYILMKPESQTTQTFSNDLCTSICIEVNLKQISLKHITNQVLFEVIKKLKELDVSADKKTTYRSLAKRIGITHPAIQARLNELIEEGLFTRESIDTMIKGSQ